MQNGRARIWRKGTSNCFIEKTTSRKFAFFWSPSTNIAFPPSVNFLWIYCYPVKRWENPLVDLISKVFGMFVLLCIFRNNIATIYELAASKKASASSSSDIISVRPSPNLIIHVHIIKLCEAAITPCLDLKQNWTNQLFNGGRDFKVYIHRI